MDSTKRDNKEVQEKLMALQKEKDQAWQIFSFLSQFTIKNVSETNEEKEMLSSFLALYFPASLSCIFGGFLQISSQTGFLQLLSTDRDRVFF